jgi:hypothetical protein
MWVYNSVSPLKNNCLKNCFDQDSELNFWFQKKSEIQF